MTPDVAIVLEGTTANDMPEVKNVGFVTKMGHGPAISFMDNATIVSPDMFKALTETAAAADIKWQPRQGTTGSNDQGPAQRMRAGCKTGCISVPCRYKIIYKKELAAAEDKDALYKKLVADYREKFSKPYQAAESGIITDVINPAETRSKISLALRTLLSKRVKRPNKKHGLSPL